MSNHNTMFSWRNKKYISTFWLKKVPYLDLGYGTVPLTSSTQFLVGVLIRG